MIRAFARCLIRHAANFANPSKLNRAGSAVYQPGCVLRTDIGECRSDTPRKQHIAGLLSALQSAYDCPPHRPPFKQESA
jgi:hypothetical protein